MIVDGRAIAEDIYKSIAATIQTERKRLTLTVFTCAPTKETEQFLRLKIKKARSVGINVAVVEFDQSATTKEVVQSINKAALEADGMIVQLPFPAHIDTESILKAVPPPLDVDASHYETGSVKVLPPVVGAIESISIRHNVSWPNKKVAVVGQGRLVGKPAAYWAVKKGAVVTIVDKDTPESEEILRTADIIVSGAGVPGLITPEKIKASAVIFDAGTSEDGGVMKGDADPTCASKCSLFTPVPGGIGPITVAVLLRNLVSLRSQ